METIFKFFRKNYVLANCENAIIKKAFSLNLSHYQISEAPEIIGKCESLIKLFLNQNKLTKESSLHHYQSRAVASFGLGLQQAG
ncbi:GL10804 [Drosophila persimilis]|uniref:GL10804 n=1 Tax=Drosophila persimilis TaxID=7234 RepID=B4G9X3_DROPE|nr:GL10804 [Drosophila persimilis]